MNQGQRGSNFRQGLRILLLLLPLALLNGFFHEFGHAFWGSLVGYRLRYMQLTFFEVYPQLGITSNFCVGCVLLDGENIPAFGAGLCSLGGSLTTTITAWVFGVLRHYTPHRPVSRLSFSRLVLLGLLDLPLYVVLPQLGLRHLIIIGGTYPEPLVGARLMGVPDPIFYGLMLISTIGLLLLLKLSKYK